jgi:hypothetical protein
MTGAHVEIVYDCTAARVEEILAVATITVAAALPAADVGQRQLVDQRQQLQQLQQQRAVGDPNVVSDH